MNNYLTILTIIMTLLFIACPKPTPPYPAVCEDGYHPCGPDSQECCLDTTSHDFTWELDSLGAYGSQIFDAAIISDDDIWLAGEIYVWELDTVSGIIEEERYNAIHWDGVEWSQHVAFDNTPLNGVFAFNSDDVWFVTGCSVIHYDGQTFEQLWICDYEQFGFWQTATVWGTSPSNIYFAGYRGVVIHFDGSTFTRIDTGIDTDFRDITGTPDGEHVFIVGSPWYRAGEDVVIHSNGNPLTWTRLEYPLSPSDNNAWPDIYSADVLEDTLYVPTEAGLWKYNFISGVSEFDVRTKQENTIYRLTVVETSNDIFLGGANMDFDHFNGVSHMIKNEIEPLHGNVVMKGGDYNGQVAIMVGYYNSWEHALIARGYR